ncbi:MAG TPA: aminoacetone oxidase family FAD-binding enzyme [Clostridiales bacterium]|nr:aminoacetone oxidase family FAD-binding enzyme [Clostridiales bacterium]
MENLNYDLAIIGAGASGLMAAAAASKCIPGSRILLLEKNATAGKKLYATGNGRCNFLNQHASAPDFNSREGSGSAAWWIAPALNLASPFVLEKIFFEMGVPAIAQEEGRLYPRSLQAESVVEALLLSIETEGVQLRTDAAVASCQQTPQGFILEDVHGKRETARCVILATGGKAGMQYGSQGDGYRLASALGHRIVKPIPALTQLLLEDPDPTLFGVRVRGEIRLYRHRAGISELAARDRGEVQMTREGISGICTFNVSRFYEIQEGVDYTAQLDFFPESAPEELLTVLTERCQLLGQRPASTFLNGMLPVKLAQGLLREAGADPGGSIKEISVDILRRIAALCKSYERRVTGTKSWKDAQVTAGGVSLKEVDPLRLMSRRIPGFYFAGEILDVDGPCGGYNLTWAFASGWIAGTAAGETGCCD